MHHKCDLKNYSHSGNRIALVALDKAAANIC